MALHIKENRQVAADADRIEMIEEEEPVAAEKILDVVLGRHNQGVDPGLLHQRVQPARIEGNWRRPGGRLPGMTRGDGRSRDPFHVLLPH